MSGRLLLIAVIIGSLGCSERGDRMFSKIDPARSGISFSNHIEENVDFNILTYEYLYNGGGVATGDVNNDGLADIMLTGNMVPNKLYLNSGNLSFEDVSETAGIQGRERWKTGVTMADVDGDGFLDLYVCYSGPGSDSDRRNELYINQGIKGGKPVFKESAVAYGLDAVGTYSTIASFFDIDNDGDLDMFLVNHADMFFNPFFNTEKLRSTRHPKFGNRLYRNDNGHYSDISVAAGITGSGLNFGLSVSTSDINNDGWTDIYVTNDYDERDFLYINNHDGTFHEVLDKAAGHLSEFAMGSDIADYNNDGKADIAVMDMLPEDNHRQKLLKGADNYDKYTLRVSHGYHHQQMRNTLQLNNGTDSSGTPVFSEVGHLAGIAATDWSWAPLFADFDNDGLKDLFITNGINKDITNLDFVKYTSGYSANFVDKKGDKVAMWELIGEMPSTKIRNYMFHNKGDLSFDNRSLDWGFNEEAISNGAAYADLDNDGDLDLVINNLNDVATIYENHSPAKNHYLSVKLTGTKTNSQSIGAKLTLRTSTGMQVQEHFLTRGFQSSIDPVVHFGLGADSIIRDLDIEWPGGGVTKLQNVKADQMILVGQETSGKDTIVQTITPAMFQQLTPLTGLTFRHTETGYVDFKTSPLLPYQLSKIGPCLAQADVNGDGLDDVFIGASAPEIGTLFFQTSPGKFVKQPAQPWNEQSKSTSAAAIFFDADSDGDNDLYIVSGGADAYLNSKTYQDRLFRNDAGRFVYDSAAIPSETVSGGCVAAADIDHDGKIDLFVGGKLSPGAFPRSPESFLFKNVSSKGQIRFVKDKTQPANSMYSEGMVTDAVFTDLNKDGWIDLVIAGMFMPVKVYENRNGRLSDASEAYGLNDTDGWWCRILADDLDNDGDTDLVIGNLGNNTQFKASTDKPITITYADFNNDGVTDPILCYWVQGKSYPYFSRDELFEQMPGLQKQFGRYADYADASLKDIASSEQLKTAKTVSIKTTSSSLFINSGNRHFNILPLPAMAQISMINGIVCDDVDKDGKKDLLIAGNFFPFRAQLGPLDAGIGLFMKGDGKGNFKPVVFAQDGLLLRGDIRDMKMIHAGKEKWLVTARNNDAVDAIRIKN